MKLSGWVRDQNGAGSEEPIITTDLSREITARPLPRYADRARRALTLIARTMGLTDNYHNDILSDRAFRAGTYSVDAGDAFKLIRLLEAEGWVEILEDLKKFRLSPKGMVAAEELAATSTSAQAFVAMSFDASMSAVWESGFALAIEYAGYKPFRIDGKEHVNGISDEIIAEIRRSRFIIADYTEHKPGVYWEAGYALGIGFPVIQSCRDTDFKGMHFDIRHINTLKWSTAIDLVTSLERRIRAVVGAGPHLSPPH